MNYLRTVGAVTIVALLLACNSFAQSPGAVSTNLSLWLKANSGPEEAVGDPAETGDALTRWLDSSPNGRHYISVAGPTLQDNALNFNPAVEILSGGFDAPAGSELSTGWTVITVSRKLASDPDGRVFDGHIANNLWSHWGTFTNSIYINANPNNYNSGIATQTGILNLHLHSFVRTAATGSIEARADGSSLATFNGTNTASGVRIDINAGASGELSNSHIGEMIVYSRSLTAAELLRVESYLAIKYGITLSHNYVTSAGTTIWDVTANAGFNSNIAGIGASAGSALDQRISKGINSSAVVTMDKGGAFTVDESYLMWGDNGATSSTLNVQSPYTLRLNRVWKTAVTGTPGPVSVSVDLLAAGLPNTNNVADYALLLDTDSDLSSGATPTAAASLVGNTLTFTNVDIATNTFFTFAVTNPTIPGGVATQLSTWLKGNGAVWEAPGDQAEDTDAITSWQDASGQGHHYTTGVAGPTWRNSTMNFNPAVEILNGGLDAPVGAELTTEWTTFFVSTKLSSDVSGRVFDGHTGNYLWAWWDVYTNSLYINGNPANHNTGIASTSGLTNLHLHTYKRQTSGSLEARADGTSLNTFGSSASASGIRIDIENGAFSGESSDARVGEMIIYNSALSATDVNKVESYLAIKYGVTLTHDYVASDATTMWSIAGNAGYNSDIAGIGRDDLSGLAQPKSAPVNAASVTMDKGGAFGADRTFLMWGNNGATGLGTNVPPAFKYRPNKIWKPVLTGTPGAVSVTFDLALIGLPSTGSASDYALLIDTDTDFSTGATEHTSGASLVGTRLTFTGVNLANNNFFTVAGANIAFPGNITGVTFWVKGNTGVVGASDVSQWTDQSGFANNAVQVTVANQPNVISNNINFYPSVNFSGNTDIFNLTTPLTNLNSTVFTVAIPNVNTLYRTMFRGATNDHPLLIEQNGNRLGYFDNKSGGFKPSGFTWLQNEIALATLEMRTGDVNFRKNGTQDASINTISLTGVTMDYFGNYQGNSQPFGRIAETIVYNSASALTTTEKEKIESYLATTWGLTLTHNYIASDATVIWNVATNAGYNNTITGIGRDDSGALDQRRSRSVVTGAGLTIDKGGPFGADKVFLVCGSDGAAAGTSFNVSGTYSVRSARIWKASVTGAPGTITLSVDLATLGVPNTGVAADYALLKDTDTDFSSGATAHTTGASIVSGTLSFTGVSFAHNDFFAIAVSNVPVPGGVAGNVFWVKGETGVVGTTDVSQWTDQGGFANNATQGTIANQPALLTNNINFRNTVEFSNSGDVLILSNPVNNLNTTVFAVAAPRANGQWSTMFRGSTNDHPIIVEASTSRLGFYDADGGAFINGGFTWAQNEVALVSLEMRTGDVNFRKNGSQGSSIGTIDVASPGLNLYAFGNYQSGSQQFGRIAETIIFNTASAITTTDKQKVESYLALKYGITLTHNYLTSAGTVVWNTTTNSTYNNNVTGIGRDDVSGLNQIKTLSVHSGASVTVETSSVVNNAFLVFGDDGGTGTSNNVPSSFLTRTNRVWKTAVTGSPGAVSVSFNLTALGLPTTGSASDFAVLVDTDADFSTGSTSHTTGASLVGSTLTFTNLTLSNNNFFTLAASNLVLPGGLTGSTMWVKGDVGVTGTANVSAWADQSGNGRNLIQATVANQPTLVTNNLNSHSVINFDNASDIFDVTPAPSNLNTTAFIVGVPHTSTATWRTFIRGSGGDHQMLIESGGTRLGYYDPDGGPFVPSGLTWLPSEPAIASVELRTGSTIFRKNGTAGNTIATINHAGQPMTWFGNYSGGNQAPGRIAEIIYFNTASAIPTADKEKIESYLGVKYGITVAHNYVNTSGTVVWNSTTNATYHNEVAGIGRDDATGLDQRRSASVNTGAVVTMDLGGAFGVNNSYLIWGNTTGAMSSAGVTDLPSGVVARLAREWKIARLGTVGAVTIQVNLNAVPGSKTAADLRLLVDRNLSGTFADETSGGGGVISGATSLGGGIYQFTGVTFNNNELFTIGSVSASTPLPIILTDFSARLIKTGVNIEWTTTTEVNNDHFTIDKSSDGEKFYELSTVPAAGNSSTPRSYNFVDQSPLPGRSYYRLTQTDFDGRLTISKVATIHYEPAWVLYPNPATKEVSLDIDGHESFTAEIVNSLGQKVNAKQTIASGRVTWNVENLPRGIYFITILRGESLTTQKLVLAD
ncbi:MAG TPA: T9SS type A sorting domain-containing protein [Cyclobacteriaceae bacterium]|nr:T9SS type A sorting domain-containing protein [Cyclobacteriaceae bacterium]